MLRGLLAPSDDVPRGVTGTDTEVSAEAGSEAQQDG